LTEVDLPKTTTIPGFANCKFLTHLNIPSVTQLSNDALRSCVSLVSLRLPEATSLLTNALRGCSSLVYADFTKLTTIYAYCFCGNSSMVALILRNTEQVVTLQDGTVFECLGEPSAISNGTGYVYVPRALVDSYKVATNWSVYANQFRALEDYTVDGTVTGELDETKI
jgi:hypothetical protein